MPRVLKDITINEVSGVDRGAGEGVRVVLIKRHDQQHQESEMTEAEIQKMIADGVAKASEVITKAATDAAKASADALAAANSEIAVLKMSGDEKAFCDKKGMDDAARKTFAAKTPEERKAAMSKSADDGKLPAEVLKALSDSTAVIAKQAEQISDLQKRVGAADEKDAIATFAKRATDLGLKVEDGEIMRKAYTGDATAQTELDKRIKALTKSLQAMDSTSVIFKEFGAGGGDGTGATAYDQLVVKATELRKTEPKLTPEQAFAKVYTDPANARLAADHRGEELIRKRAITG